MPKFVREQDRDRFRIVPVGRIYHIEEKKNFLGLWDRWTTIKWYSEFAGPMIRYFNSEEEAKAFIDELLKSEEEARYNEAGGVIYYP